MSSRNRFVIAALWLGVALFVTPLRTYAQPEAPSDVEVTIRGENAVDVTWVDNSDNEVAFEVWRSDGGADSRPVGVVDANLRLFQDRASGLVPNVEYCYTIFARNSAGRSDPSNTICVTIPPRPTSPSGLIVSRVDNNAPIALTWIDNSTNEDGFLIYRDTRGTGFILEDTVAAVVNRYDDMEVRTGGDYCYFVSSFNVSGESEGSNISCIEVTIGVPVLPIAFELETLSGTVIGLRWEFGLITHQELSLQRSLGGVDPWIEVLRTSELVTQFRDEDLDPDTEYCYRIELESASGATALTDIQCSRTEFTVPPTPRNIDAEGMEGGVILVTWAVEPTPRARFRIERRDGLGEFLLIADSVDALEYTDPGLSADETYCYRVQTFNPEFESTFSSIACAIVAPAPVANLTVTAGPQNRTREVTASWDQGSGPPATSFEVSFREAADGDFSTPTVTSDLSLLIGGLQDATEYEVQVVAFRARDSLSALSSAAIASGSTLLSVWPGDMDDDGTVTANDAVVLTSPDCFGMTTAFTSNGLDVSWREHAVDPSGADPTVLRCDADQNGTVEIFDFLAIAANAGRQTDGGRAEAGEIPTTAPSRIKISSETHRMRLRQIYESFEPVPGDAAQEELKNELGKILQEAGTAIIPDELAIGSLYPNPVHDRAVVTVDLPADSGVRLSIFGVAGQEVRVLIDGRLTAGRHEAPFDADGLASGVYFIVLESDEAVLTRPVVVAR